MNENISKLIEQFKTLPKEQQKEILSIIQVELATTELEG